MRTLTIAAIVTCVRYTYCSCAYNLVSRSSQGPKTVLHGCFFHLQLIVNTGLKVKMNHVSWNLSV